ncbi:MAG: dephospho-CoA kinase [Aquificaceae bacterium]
MLKLGLTGNIASGKSTVGKIFESLGAYYFDADKIIKSFYKKDHSVYYEILKHFGEEILDPSGEINRGILANLVFSDQKKLKKLEEITHSALYEHLNRNFLTLPESSIVVVEAALIIEKQTYKNYDAIILVYSTFEDCLLRATLRGMSAEDFLRRWRYQLSPEIKTRFAHFIIKNSSSLKELSLRAKEVFDIFRLWSVLKS